MAMNCVPLIRDGLLEASRRGAPQKRKALGEKAANMGVSSVAQKAVQMKDEKLEATVGGPRGGAIPAKPEGAPLGSAAAPERSFQPRQKLAWIANGCDTLSVSSLALPFQILSARCHWASLLLR